MTTIDRPAAVLLGERELLHEGELAMPLAYRQVVQALRVLDGQCDGGRARDGLGFNRAHAAGPGRDFARLYRSRGSHLTSKQYAFAYRIASTYTRQLADAGVPLPTVNEASAVETYLAERDAARQARRLEESERLVAAATAPRPSGAVGSAAAPAADCRLELHGETLWLIFPYNKELIKKVYALRDERDKLAQKNKALGFVRFEKVGGAHWEVPLDLLAQVADAFPGFARDEAVERRLADLVIKTEIDAWNARIEAERERERMIKLADALGKLSAPLPSGRVLYKHQREAVISLGRWGSGILGHEMGLGKSTTAAVLAKAYHKAFGARVIVVGPRTLRVNWLRETAAIGLSIEYYTYEKMPEAADMAGTIWGDVPYVVFFDEAHYLQSMSAQRTKRAIPLAWGALAAVLLTGTPIKNGRPVNIYPLLLATKHELVYAAKPDGSPDLEEIAQRKRDFLRRYCASGGEPVTVAGRQIFDMNGARQLDELHRMIVGSPRGVLRKRKDECLDLPRKIRKFVPVEIDGTARAAYYRDLDEMWQAYERRLAARIEKYKATEWENEVQAALARHIETFGAPENEAALAQLYDELRTQTLEAALERFNSGEALVNLNNLRQCGSRAKIAPTVAMMADIFEQDEIEAAEAQLAGRKHKPAAFVVFSGFIETARAVAAAFPGAGVIDGDTSDDARQAAIDDFQAGKRRVVSCVYGAGGVGVTLTAATHVVLLDRAWTPGDCEQAEDRGHRIGLEEDILALWMQLPEAVSPIDEKIDGVLLQKQERTLKTLDGNLDNLPPDILFKNIASSLVSEVMAARRGARAQKTDE